MHRLNILDGSTPVLVLRDQTPYIIAFSNIEKGDVVCNEKDEPWFTAGDNAHMSENSNHKRCLVHDTNGNSYYPNNFLHQHLMR